jgi:hypothetical protein
VQALGSGGDHINAEEQLPPGAPSKSLDGC